MAFNKSVGISAAIAGLMAVALVVSITVMSEKAESQFKNPGECINFGENKEISRDLGNMRDYAKACTFWAPGKK
jgi:hypothetical protein